MMGRPFQNMRGGQHVQKMIRLMRGLPLLASALLVAGLPASGAGSPPKELAPPVIDGAWLRPAPSAGSRPVWGHREGIRVGLWPTPGPRGLLRIYAPYLGHGPLRMINYIAVEPIVKTARGYSELEHSRLDDARGKAMWTDDALARDPQPRPPWQPARGQVETVDGVERLTVFVFVERFRNGARPIVQVVLRRDRPHEVGLRVFAAKGGAPMRSCVLTATMGNYARLRHLWLRGEVVAADRLWPRGRVGKSGFTRHARWGLDRMLVIGEQAIVAATPNEADPASAVYAESVPRPWRYQDKVATQYWRCRATRGLAVQVNGRVAYWASRAPIPGGISYENFEMVAPFADGQTFVFGVSPKPPEVLRFRKEWRRNLTDGH
jgi:hypothetical protein